MAPPVRAQLYRGELGGVHWELATRPPARPLAAYVRDLQGYIERSAANVRRREFSGTAVVVIFEFEPRLRVYEHGESTRHARYPGGFVAGLDETYTWTEHAGYQAGIQLNLQPLAARRVFGLPLRELRGRVVCFEDLLPAQRGLSEELAELSSWDARFDRVERFLTEQLSCAKPNDRAVSWALERIAAHGGQIDLEHLARELGYSHKHVIARFHDQVGITPKLWARIVRFERLRRELTTRGTPRSWAELALACGYYDQAHLAREVKQFTGDTPRALLRPTAFQANDDR
ncbi:MAG TPA: helix-turn-helix domain-containing protein [Polyangiales bacterium]|nr:helix-turn-helix domain-containing protein [Polyangiales bacterium]